MKFKKFKMKPLALLSLALWQPTLMAQNVPQLGVDSIENVIAAMTAEEKVSLVTGTGMPGFDGLKPVVGAIQGRVPGAAGGTFAITRLGIPEIIVADGPAGVRISPTRDNDKATYYATAFPVGTALASTWNTQLLEQVGKAMGSEAKEYGLDVLLGPALNIHRNPLCGRNFEYYSEDPLISGKTAAAMVNGIQSNHVGTSIKHFVANNQETNRLSINETISERAMREIYLKGFEITVKESQPWTVMSSYNLINGTYTSARKDLLSDILRDEWGFKGVVMTDWFGGYTGFNQIGSEGSSNNEVAQLTAGNDLLMPGLDAQKASILASLKNGRLTEAQINTNVRRLLELIVKSPYFHQYSYSDTPDLQAHAQITRQAAAEGMVLLKNEKHVLPYSNKTQPISVFGVNGYNFISGGTGSGDVNEAYTVSLLEGLTNAGYKIDSDLEALYTPFTQQAKHVEQARREKAGFLSTPQRFVEMDLSSALIAEKAKSSDIALITIGRNAGENADRQVADDFNLANDEIKLLDQVSKAFHAQNKKVVVILNIGGVIETASWKDKVDAILLAWQPGQEGGNSVADILSGKVNPSGKLTMTFPVNYSDTPSAKNWLGTPKDDPKQVSYEEGIYVGYRYFNSFNVKPSYEFGYGLSYSDFDFTDLQVNATQVVGQFNTSVTIKNIGKVAGKQVAELYLSAPAKMIDKPTAELKAFAKTKILQPGESQTLTMPLQPKDLASFIPSRSAWIAEVGTYNVAIGTSSLDIKQNVKFDLSHEVIAEKVHKTFARDKPLVELKAK
ncbi:MAG: beta-glucosidase [Psychromonas sp.]|jgi:beta-glucosidase|uniref:glycoside hydrolase family 3 C-terminal domain-containing protein n=1 Tax=Psychromonas sp. TaxID=1884585 RepID=UPI0039E25505